LFCGESPASHQHPLLISSSFCSGHSGKWPHKNMPSNSSQSNDWTAFHALNLERSII